MLDNLCKYSVNCQTLSPGPSFCKQIRLTINFLVVCAIILSSLIQSSPLYGRDIGTTGADFLRVTAGPRATALGGAYTALADDGFGMYWNPAGISRLEHGVFSASHQQLFPGVEIDNEFLSFAYPAGEHHTFGLAGRLLHTSDSYRTEWEDGSTFTNYSGSLATHYAYGGRDGLAYGVGVKLIRERLAGYEASSYAVDLGLHYRSPASPLRLGLALRNLGPEIKFIDEGDPLPAELRAGWAYDFYPFSWRLTLSNDLIYYQPEDISATAFGLEYSLLNLFELRGGYVSSRDFDSDGQFFTGLGFNHSYFAIDYSYGSRDNLEETHNFAFTVKFGERPDSEAKAGRELELYERIYDGDTELERKLMEAFWND